MALPIRKKARIQTRRLTIMPFSRQDAADLADLLTDPEVTRTFMVPEISSRSRAEDLANRLIGLSRQEDTGHLVYGVYRDGTVIGFINDCGIGEDEIEIGYVIHPQYQGRGFATEAVRAVIAGLREMGFRKVIAGYFSENMASLRVMEKCGMGQTDRTEEIEYRGERHICRYCEICF